MLDAQEALQRMLEPADLGLVIAAMVVAKMVALLQRPDRRMKVLGSHEVTTN